MRVSNDPSQSSALEYQKTSPLKMRDTIVKIVPGNCVSADSWVGCDRIMPLKLKVNELTRAEREGRTHRGKQVPADKADANSEAGGSDDEDEEEDEEG